MALTVKQIENAAPREKNYKLSDGGGLFLQITPAGTKTWNLKYRFGGKEKRLGLGRYPNTTLANARMEAANAKDLLAQGIDPLRPNEKPLDHSVPVFEQIANEWLAKNEPVWSQKTYRDAKARLHAYAFPGFGAMPIDKITAPVILRELQKIENDGKHDLAHRVRAYCSRVFRYAIATGNADRDPASDLIGALTPVKVRHNAHLNKAELAKFLAKYSAAKGTCHMSTAGAFEFLLHTFVRTSEMRFATWDEIDWDEKLWRIPGERMKMGSPHLVPLTPAAIEILRHVQRLNGDFPYIFAAQRDPNKPISENAVLSVIYRLGYKGKITGHGFRGTANTILSESGKFNPEAIERQLAHQERNAVRRAYNHAEYMPERRKMMAWWSDLVSGMLLG